LTESALCAVLFDSGGVLMQPIGGRWNPRADFEQTVLSHAPGITPQQFAAAIAVGDRFMSEAPGTPDFDLEPAQCLFIDDDPALVEAAIALGHAGRALRRTDGGEPCDVPSITTLGELLSLFAH
jgi:hypothetical protein